MLVLTRSTDERIVIEGPGIPGKIVITVVQIRSNKVRIGVAADRSIRIDREEIHDDRHPERDRGDR
jgi:carbon storage regulator CsrA